MLASFIMGAVLFCAGFVIGSYIKAASWENEDWKILKWDKQIMGYRTLPSGGKMFRGENVVMCLKLDTQSLPEDGLVNEL